MRKYHHQYKIINNNNNSSPMSIFPSNMYSTNVDPCVYKFSVTTLYPPKNINNPNYFIIDEDNYYIDPIYRTLEVDNIYIPISKFKISEMQEDQTTHEQYDNSNIFYFQFLIDDYLENENENNEDFLGF